MAKHLLFAIYQLCLTLVALIHAQDQSGFISIDCGLMDEASYKDETTGIHYNSDANATDAGISRSISSEYKVKSLERQFLNVRSFPQGTRNCYTFYLPRINTNKRLIRARFMYGNYDRKNTLPRFDLYLGPNLWDSVEFESVSSVITMEITYVASSDYIHVCLVNKNNGTPFVSVLEIRVLQDTYDNLREALLLLERFDVGLQEGHIIRYPDDVNDRIWTPYNPYGWKQISTSLAIDNQGPFSYGVPSIVLKTAATPENPSNNLGFSYELGNGAVTKFYVYMYFAEVEKLLANETRDFNVYANGRLLLNNMSLPFLGRSTALYVAAKSRLQIWINRTSTATVSPILNGIEVYKGNTLRLYETDQNDVDAIMQIKSTYGMKQKWQGDPCSPQTYKWNGLNCSYNGYNQPRITSLNLCSSGLTGNITPAISNLKLLQYLDLSNNSLTGSIPDSLSELESLRILNIGRNKLSGSIPAKLSQRSRNNGSLIILSAGGNPKLCISSPCHKRNVVTPLVVTLPVGALILSAVASLFIFRRRLQVLLRKYKMSCFNKIESVDSKKQDFTYSEVISITNNFERVVGKGGFGTVYYGVLGETQVAVKMVSSSTQGYQQFQTEAKILNRVHHKSLTPLIGYCNEGTKTALIYEYMTNGNLAEHLSGESEKLLGWKQRLQIALDSAVGLEYLHYGCKPPIVHRDVNTRYILLNDNFHGKISDFGLSRIFSDENDTHVLTAIAGTPGYLDPEYYITNRLKEKSDVFSFGVVMLEIITGRAAIMKSHENTHIIQWVSSMLGDDDGEIDSIMDPRLQGEYDIEGARKIVDVAMACVAPSSIKRPTMNQVVIELKQCLMMGNINVGSTSSGSIQIVSTESISGYSSLER